MVICVVQLVAIRQDNKTDMRLYVCIQSFGYAVVLYYIMGSIYGGVQSMYISKNIVKLELQ